MENIDETLDTLNDTNQRRIYDGTNKPRAKSMFDFFDEVKRFKKRK